MNACDVVVLPYRDIFTSGSVFLAMSFGRACIAPHKGCIGEVLDDSGAFLYDSDEGLLQVLHYAIEKKADLPRMGKHNLQLAEQLLSWSNLAKMTLDVYQQCLSR
jgi:glycosyltransferase involved in cell wall biosynthesis